MNKRIAPVLSVITVTLLFVVTSSCNDQAKDNWTLATETDLVNGLPLTHAVKSVNYTVGADGPGSNFKSSQGRAWQTLSTVYYVDSINGSDSNPGTSEDQPWQTLAPVHAHNFQPGDVIHFKCGSSWDGGLMIDDSGVEGNPIIFTTYGDGDRPVIRNPGNMTNGISIDADWVILESLLVRDVHHRGVMVLYGSDYNIVRDMEFTDVGIGVGISGQYNLVTENYIHDLHIVSSTPGGDDDFGAVGVVMYNSYNEVSYNVMMNCKAPSHDYIYDGGAIEWWVTDGSIESSYIHHNWASDSEGFLEVGSQNGEIRDTIVAYNVSVNNGWFSFFSITGTFGTTVESFRIENNTVYQVLPHAGWGATDIFLFNDNPISNSILARNNIFYVDGWNIASHSGFTHDHNLYSLNGEAQLGFELGEGEIVTDPLFVNRSLPNFHLQPESPAIDAGVDLGHILDFENRTVPIGAVPDLGAFEYEETPAPTCTSQPTNTPTLTSQPTNTPTSTSQPTNTSTSTPQPTNKPTLTSQPTNTPTSTSQPTNTSTSTPQPTNTPTLSPNEIIIDNIDPSFSYSSSQDAWKQYTEVNGQHYGSSHHYNRQIGLGKDTATWSFTVPHPGQYKVYTWWYEGSWRPSDVPYTINYLNGSITVRFNQQTKGGQWNLLGTFDFQDQGSVIVSDDVSSGKDVVADAIKIVYFAPLSTLWGIYLPVIIHH
jgi:hypothetical protein